MKYDYNRAFCLSFLLILFQINVKGQESEPSLSESAEAKSFLDSPSDLGAGSDLADISLDDLTPEELRDAGLTDEDIASLGLGKGGSDPLESAALKEPLPDLSVAHDTHLNRLKLPDLEQTAEKSQDDTALLNLVAVLTQKNVINTLPPEVQTFLKNQSFIEQPKFDEVQKLQDDIRQNLNNTVVMTSSSEPFVDHYGAVGRKGQLVTMDLQTLTSKSVWAVINTKVFCIYESENYLTIERLIRNSAVSYIDMLATPCFGIYSEKDQRATSLCAPSIQEKEVWLQIIQEKRNHVTGSG
mmetsp:Transcript_58733/g.66946  ORF Transcript_58733/g.66946 Transcript_58733/m.66946 type:complete len:298 (-) Transcript_58733:70-963(-)